MEYSWPGAAAQAAEEGHGAEPETHQQDGLVLPVTAHVDGTFHVQVAAGALVVRSDPFTGWLKPTTPALLITPQLTRSVRMCIHPRPISPSN